MAQEQQLGWQYFLKLCQECQTTAELEELFQLLLTIEERQQLAGRVLLLRELLTNKKPQRQIASELELSIAKITRGSNALKTISKRLRAFLIQHLDATFE